MRLAGRAHWLLAAKCGFPVRHRAKPVSERVEDSRTCMAVSRGEVYGQLLRRAKPVSSGFAKQSSVHGARPENLYKEFETHEGQR